MHACNDADHVCFDIESNGFYNYRERTCIITITVPAGHFVVDSLALWDLVPELASVFSSETVLSICHGGSYDVTSLKRDFGFTFSGLRDTHIAASLLGHEGTGLASLAKIYFGLELPKELQRHDWTRRPITPEQLAYLSGDTRYLSELADIMHREIEAADLMEEYLIECELLQELPASIVLQPDPEGWRRIKNLKGLNDRHRTILRAVCYERDLLAQELDIAPFRVAGNDLLVRIAWEAQGDEVPERLMSSVNRHVRDRFYERATIAVREALKGPPPAPAVRPVSDSVRITRQEIERRKIAERRIKAWRTVEAERRKVGLQAILPTPVLDEIVREQFWTTEALARIRRLGKRRLERYGDDIIKQARG